MDNFDITCTATLRPKLLKATLDSHYKYLFGDNIKKARFIINIDMVGSEFDSDHYSVLGLLEDYNFKSIRFRIGRRPHFGKAFNWCMKSTKNRFIFHLEEDWEMLMPIDFEKMVYMFDKYPKLAHLRLSSFGSTEKTCKNWNKFLHWNGDFFEVEPNEIGVIGWSGHPSLNRRSFISKCLPYMDAKGNPEKQLKILKHAVNRPINRIIEKYRFGSFHPQNTSAAVRDIGRQWMIENGYAKKGNKAFFTEWKRT